MRSMPHRSRHLRRAAPVALLTLLGIGLSCRDAASPSPDPTVVRRDVAPAPFMATFGLTSNATTQNSMDLTDFPEARAVRITVSGTITARHLRDATHNRQFGPNGWNCVATVSVSYDGTGPAVGPSCGTPGSLDPIEGIVKVQGHGVVS